MDLVSTHSAEIQKYVELAKSIPEVRQDKVEAIKKKIMMGEYIIDGEAVANSMIDLCKDLLMADDEDSSANSSLPNVKTA